MHRMISLVVVLASCGGGGSTGASTNPTEVDSQQVAEWTSPFGLEYGKILWTDGQLLRPGAEAFAPIGARWMKLNDVRWNEIQDSAGAEYVWESLDPYVSEWQNAGFDCQVVVRCVAYWATGRLSAAPPLEEYRDDYAAFVQALVERYDGDGKDDMPGLLRPMLHYEFESEAMLDALFHGSAEDYGELLELAHGAVKAACPEAKVILSGIAFVDVFDHDRGPSTAEQRERIVQDKLTAMRAQYPEWGEEYTSAYAKQKAYFAYHPYFDIVEFHYNYGYLGAFNTVAWIQDQLAANAAGEKEIWAGDVFGAPMLINQDFLMVPPFYGTDAEQSLLYWRLYAGDAETLAWYRAEHAKLVIQKLACALASGCRMFGLGNLEDWPNWAAAIEGGLADNASEGGALRPAASAYTQAIRYLTGFTAFEMLATSSDVYAFRATVGDHSVFILWREDGEGQRPGETEATVSFTLTTGTSSVTVSTVQDPTETVIYGSGTYQLQLGSGPVFVIAR